MQRNYGRIGRSVAAPPVIFPHASLAPPHPRLPIHCGHRGLRSPGTIGHEIVRNLIQGGFTGPVYPVNPFARAICAIPAWPDIESVPGTVDRAVIVVPKDRVQAVAGSCIRKGATGLIVISAGFREIGGEGVERERALTALVRAHGVRMVGPNCMGVLNSNPAVAMNGTFARALPPYGKTGFVSQSGALGFSVLDLPP